MADKLYHIPKNAKNNLLHTGYDYTETLFEKTMSKVLLGEPKREAILKKMERVMVELIQRVKTIKTFVNFAVDKNYRDFN